jgi:hypothetical protein
MNGTFKSVYIIVGPFKNIHRARGCCVVTNFRNDFAVPLVTRSPVLFMSAGGLVLGTGRTAKAVNQPSAMPGGLHAVYSLSESVCDRRDLMCSTL